MILAAIAYIVLVLVLYRLESAQLDREALRQGRLTIQALPQQRVLVQIWSSTLEVSERTGKETVWRVEDDDGGW